MEKLYIIILLFISSYTFAQVPANYYNSATGTGYTLKTELATIIDDVNDNNGQNFHDTSVTYGDLWNLYPISDVRSDGKVWDIYGDCNFTFVTDQDTGTSGTSECQKFNREHTFPQSWYGGNNSHPMRADAFHVLPTDKYINGVRGNLAYGEVSTFDVESGNGSKRGASSIVGPTGQVFEPADEFKGDIARGYFYVAVRYQNEITSWEANDTDGDSMLDGSSTKVFEQWALDMLYSWHINDPVSQKEIDRNEAIFQHQKNRNPFIDNPQYVLSIWQSVLSTDNFQQNEIKIYPNPARGNEVTILSNNIILAEIYDILGKKVKTQKLASNQKKLNISGLNKGIYLLRLKSREGTVTKKLIRQ